jgi:hypothetical protein
MSIKEKIENFKYKLRRRLLRSGDVFTTPDGMMYICEKPFVIRKDAQYYNRYIVTTCNPLRRDEWCEEIERVECIYKPDRNGMFICDDEGYLLEWTGEPARYTRYREKRFFFGLFV